VNKVVVRFADGRIVKGMTADFVPTKDVFHVNLANEMAGAKPVEVHLKDLKALFFVRDFVGNSKHVDSKDFDSSCPPGGRKIRVEFKDGEVLVGITAGYQPGRPGFFVVPADQSSNSERCYIITASTKQVSFI
jgi:hypothetical protein